MNLARECRKRDWNSLTPVEPDNQENIRKNWDERERLSSLRGITFLIINEGIESDTTKKKIKEYNEKFARLPDELLELIEQRK